MKPLRGAPTVRVAVVVLGAALVAALMSAAGPGPVAPAEAQEGRCGLPTGPSLPKPPPITAPSKSAEAAAEYAVAERIIAGLPSDNASVAVAASDPLATTQDLGTPITVAERAQLQRALAAGLRVADVVAVARKAMPASFGAAWFDYRDGGRIYTSFTDAECPSQTALEAMRNVSLVEVVAVRAALQATDSRLRSLHQQIREDLLTLADEGILINAVGKRPHLDAVMVTLDPASADDSRESLARTYGDVGLAFAPDAPPDTPAADVRINPSAGSDVLGGQKIVNGSGRCSSNISAQDSAGRWYTVTAGHCFATNQAIAHGNSDSLDTNTYSSAKEIGRAQASQVSANSQTTCDCRVVGPIAFSRRAARTLVDNNEQFRFNFVAGGLNRYTGQPIACQNGVSSYRRHGGISCGPVDFPDEDIKACFPTYCYYLFEAFKVAFPSGRLPTEGDSGTSVGSGETLLGVLGTNTGFSSKTYNLSDVYSLASWVVPAH